MKKYILISLVAIWAAMPLMAQTSSFAVVGLLTKKINNTAATTYSLTNDYERIYQKNH